MRVVWLVLGLVGSGPAWAVSGGGPTLFPAQLDGWMPCVGGQGFSASRGLRLGGEGGACVGDAARLGTLGAHAGWQSPNRGGWVTAGSGLGLGGFAIDRADGHVGGTVLYARPSVGLGLPLSPKVALETSLFVSVNAPVYQRARDTAPVPVFATGGVQIGLSFGDFRRDPPKGAPPPPPRPGGAPVVAREAPPPVPAAVQPDDLPTERPLAVVPPKPPPPPPPPEEDAD